MTIKITVPIIFMFLATSIFAQSPVGKWKTVSHTILYEGKKLDMHAALLTQRPCAANIVWEINTDATFRLNASASGCDERYKSIQERLYSKTKWKVEDGKITTSATNFEVGQTYTISFDGNNMNWVGVDEQGTIVYKKVQ